MEKLRENEFPLDTTVKVMGFVEARPISTYTENIEEQKMYEGRILFGVYLLGILIAWTLLEWMNRSVTIASPKILFYFCIITQQFKQKKEGEKFTM